MKCVKQVKTDVIKRVDNDSAEALVWGGFWEFVPKSEWKAQEREHLPESIIPMSQRLK